jgi:proline dehydrogenase
MKWHSFLYLLAKRFIAGHDFESAKPVIKKMMENGYEVSIDYVGELSSDVNDCKEATEQYIKIIKYYWDKKIDISIKPSQLGLLINPEVSYANLNEIAKMAKKFGHTIRLDMEDSRVTELTRNQAIFLNNKYGNVGVAIQANLHRTEKDLRMLIDNNVSVRLVKGAYKESEDIAHQEPSEIEQCFFHYAANLYSNKANKPAVGTHDEELLEDIEELIPNADYFDYEFLYGVRRDLQRKFKNQGKTVRIYIPFGTEWLPYALRRLKEWKNFKFVIRNIFKEWLK